MRVSMFRNGVQKRRNVRHCFCGGIERSSCHTAADKWAPSCNSDGSWACQQMDYWIGNWCVDKDGNQNRKTRKRDDRNTYEPCPPCSGSNSLAEQIWWKKTEMDRTCISDFDFSVVVHVITKMLSSVRRPETINFCLMSSWKWQSLILFF